MNKRDLERAERLVKKSRLAERTERSRHEIYDWIVTVFWLSGPQTFYANIEEVRRAIKWRKDRP